MRVAVASGKGGTGKTILATSLALSWEGSAFADCDVEAPNAHLLLRPDITSRRRVTVPVPRVREEDCLHCGECADFCRYNALAVLPEQWMVFDELCHSCGGCSIVCPTRAIDEVPRQVGTILEGRAGDIPFLQGVLDEGEAQAVPVIQDVLKALPRDVDVILDSPPGASCPMLAVAEAADVVLLVTEPTPFGLHDLEAAIRAVRQLDRPMAVLINRSDWGDGSVERICREHAIPILLEIPHSLHVARGYARGRPLVETIPSFRPSLEAIRTSLRRLAREAAA
ncbi:MAG TPA: (4Fe-4S)-binding protein [Acidobacteria bacterium]|nr:(4Fe-4S)-binding protein [Acidobacteriota bacterium]